MGKVEGITQVLVYIALALALVLGLLRLLAIVTLSWWWIGGLVALAVVCLLIVVLEQVGAANG
jgi:hypothetical protein